MFKVFRKIKACKECVTSVSYDFNVNGEKVSFVSPQRGLRQGDPLSPYLFLLFTEGFSNLIQKAVNCGKITSVRISRGGPTLSPLFFADDSLIFCRANVQEAQENSVKV